MGAEMHENSTNEVPNALARDVDILVLNPETQNKLKQESAKNAARGGLSSLDALAKLNAPKQQEKSDTTDQADKVDEFSRVESRMSAMEQLGKNIEKIIGHFDGDHAQELRDEMCRQLEIISVKDLGKIDLREAYKDRDTSQYPLVLRNEATFSKMAQELSRYIEPVLAEEKRDANDLAAGNSMLEVAFTPHLDKAAATAETTEQGERSQDDIAAENKRDEYVMLAGDLSKFTGLLQSPALKKYNLGTEMEKAITDQYNLTDGDKQSMFTTMKNGDLKDPETYNAFLEDLLRAAKTSNNGSLNPDSFSQVEIKELVAKINGEGTVATR